jgi:heme oxygenase (mycobilin-producing)
VSVVRINALDVPPERAEELVRRFAARAGEVSRAPGFEAFELLRPTDGRSRFLVYTRWSSEEAFRAWAESPAFERGHRSHAAEGPAAAASELWSFDVVQREEGGGASPAGAGENGEHPPSPS